MDLSTLNEPKKRPMAPVVPEFAGGKEGVRQRLEMLDSLIEEETGIHPDCMAAARTCVADVMIELKANAECAKLLVDKDIHNMLIFSRMTSQLATESTKKAITKRTTKSEKAAKAKEVLSGMSLDLGLDALAGMDMTKIKKVTR